MTDLKGTFVLKYTSGYTQQRTRALVRLGKNERLTEYTCSCVRRGPEIGEVYGFKVPYAKPLIFYNKSQEKLSTKSLTLYIYYELPKPSFHETDLFIKAYSISPGGTITFMFDRHPICYETRSNA